MSFQEVYFFWLDINKGLRLLDAHTLKIKCIPWHPPPSPSGVIEPVPNRLLSHANWINCDIHVCTSFFSMLESWNFNFIPSNGLSKSIIIMRFIFAGQYNSYKVWQRGRKTSNGRNYKKKKKNPTAFNL